MFCHRVVRRHPDIKWLRRASDIEAFAQQQQQILSACGHCWMRGKLPLCDMLDIWCENQQVIDEFLTHHRMPTSYR